MCIRDRFTSLQGQLVMSCTCAESFKIVGSQIMSLPKASRLTWYEFQGRYVIMVNFILRLNFVKKLQCFQGFFGKKGRTRVLVSNLVEISKESLIFYWFKNHCWKTRFTTNQSPRFVTFWIQLFRERLSKKSVHATIPKSNMGSDIIK